MQRLLREHAIVFSMLLLITVMQLNCAENTGNQVSNIKTPTTVNAPTVTPTPSASPSPSPSISPSATPTASQPIPNSTGANIAATIKDRSVADDCGCYFHVPGKDAYFDDGPLVLFFDIDYVAVMNLDGKDVKLKLVSNSGELESEKIGSKSQFVFAIDLTKVTIDRVLTKNCDQEGEGCESYGYMATITVQKGNEKQVFKSNGTCGC